MQYEDPKLSWFWRLSMYCVTWKVFSRFVFLNFAFLSEWLEPLLVVWKDEKIQLHNPERNSDIHTNVTNVKISTECEPGFQKHEPILFSFQTSYIIK